MAKKKTNQTDSNFENVESALSRVELFIEKNQKRITYVLFAIVIVVFGYFGFAKFIAQPKAETAFEEIFIAERYFEQDSFQLALEGDGVNYGFLDIIDNYRRTPAGNLAFYYAGISYLNLGEFEAAIEYLNRFSADDVMLEANAVGAIGDSYLELDDLKSAVKNYEKAAKIADNDFLSPIFLMKAGKTYEIDGQYQKALDIYNRIETEYYGTREQRNIEKYQARVEMKMQ
ncbi:MAG: tetratricopeptide repeat protein [Bacteroidota bacterium]|nr:tetratricopeptide repeat protein [Bacteroidota bacterium]